MGSLVTGSTPVVWGSIGLVLVRGPLPLEAAVGPNAAEAPPAQGGPIAVPETPREGKIERPGDVLCDCDTAAIRPEAAPIVRQVAGSIQREPQAKGAVAG
jgi:hypothetical protein